MDTATIEHAACTSCGNRFERGTDEHWKRLCWSCWARDKGPGRGVRGEGPPYVRVSERHIRYPREEVPGWLASRMVTPPRIRKRA